MAIAADLAESAGPTGVHPERRASSLPPDVKQVAAKLTAELSATETSFGRESLASADTATVAGREDAAPGRSSISDGGPAADVARGPAGGNLFLTCLRLRFEQHGSWEAALRTKSPVREEQQEDAAQDGNDEEKGEASSSRAGPSGQRRQKPTWKEWAGRDQGDDRYRLGDFYRGAVRSARRHLERRRSWHCESAKTPDSSKTTRGHKFAALFSDPSLVFGVHGASIELGGEEPPRSEAARLQGSTVSFGSSENCLAVTAGPLPALRPAGEDIGSSVTRYYFEFRVVEWEALSTRTLMLGFMWNPPACGAQGNETLPAAASELPQAFVVGGDLPRWFLGGRDLGRVGDWRPRIHTVAGSVIGALLEAQRPGTEKASPATLRMVIFQDGLRRSELLVELTQPEASWVFLPETEPHGLVDVSGSVRRVRLQATAMDVANC